jgi:hypothetical protein
MLKSVLENFIKILLGTYKYEKTLYIFLIKVWHTYNMLDIPAYSLARMLEDTNIPVATSLHFHETEK